jgi:hypothetical protein
LEYFEREGDLMSLKDNAIDDFYEYIEYYPYSDEEGYDGIHDGGWKGLREDAPEKAKKAYEKFRKMEEEAKKKGIKL